MPPDNAARGLYRYVGSLTRPVTYTEENRKLLSRAAMPPDNAARGLYRYVGSLTRPVTYTEKTESF